MSFPVFWPPYFNWEIFRQTELENGSGNDWQTVGEEKSKKNLPYYSWSNCSTELVFYLMGLSAFRIITDKIAHCSTSYLFDGGTVSMPKYYWLNCLLFYLLNILWDYPTMSVIASFRPAWESPLTTQVSSCAEFSWPPCLSGRWQHAASCGGGTRASDVKRIRALFII
jgi:hypothetical protein